MAEFKSEEIGGLVIKSQTEFSEMKNGVSLSGLDYAMDGDMIDWVRIGRVRYIVLTPKSEAYQPSEGKMRSGRKKTIMLT